MKTKIMRCAFLLLVAAVATGVAARAQNAPDFSKVEIKTNKLADNFYTLDGQGGEIGVLTGPDGVLMVDAQFAPLSQKIAAAIHQVSNQPIRFLINTHVHADHTGGNENFAKMGATILARPQLRERLIHPAPGPNGAAVPGSPVAALPVITYDAPVTIHMDGEDVRLIPIPRAHTDGDTLVMFPHDDIIMCGDFFRSIQYPNIDRANGGSLDGMLDGLGRLVGMADAKTRIVPGHGPMVSRNEVQAHRDMIIAIRDKVAALVAQGKTQEEVLAAHPTADYDAKVPNSKETTERFVTQLYQELKK